MKLEIDETRHVAIAGGIDVETVGTTIAKLSQLADEAPDEPIFLSICSPGGDIGPGLWLADYIQYIEPEVVGIAAGTVHSTALAIFAACDRRYSFKSTGFLSHPAAFEGTVVDHSSLLAQKDEYEWVHIACENIELPAFRNMTKTEYAGIAYTSKFFNADQAMAFGLLDGILS